jgi:hypothetical protein
LGKYVIEVIITAALTKNEHTKIAAVILLRMRKKLISMTILFKNPVFIFLFLKKKPNSLFSI